MLNSVKRQQIKETSRPVADANRFSKTSSSPHIWTIRHCWHSTQTLHLKCNTSLTHFTGNISVISTTSVWVAAAPCRVKPAIRVTSGGLEVNALLQLCHNVSHVGSMLRRLSSTFKCRVGDFPNTVDIIVATHAGVHHTLDVSTGETLLHPLDYAGLLRVI
jgi:hypothetical protein